MRMAGSFGEGDALRMSAVRPRKGRKARGAMALQLWCASTANIDATQICRQGPDGVAPARYRFHCLVPSTNG